MSCEEYKLLIIQAVYVLKKQLEDEELSFSERLNPMQALNAIKQQAEALDIPLSEIDLEGYDIDALLQKRPNGRQVGHGED